MKRIWTWVFYGIGALAIAYLALYAYAAFTGRGIELENPIHIFRRPDAPDYSRRSPVPAPRCSVQRCSAEPGSTEERGVG